MKNSLIVLSLIFGLLIAGCAAPEQEPTQPAAPEAPEAGENVSPPAEEPAAPEEPAEPAEPEEPAEEPGGGMDLAGMEYAALMALGIPLECDITTTTEGVPMTVKLYMNGEDEVRVEAPVEESPDIECKTFVSITKADKYYIGCAEASLFPQMGCDWLEIEATEEDSEMVTEVQFTEGASVDTDYSDVPPSDIDCKAWTYDASKFAPAGKICTMEDLMQGYEFG